MKKKKFNLKTIVLLVSKFLIDNKLVGKNFNWVIKKFTYITNKVRKGEHCGAS